MNADGYVSTGTGLIGFNMYAYCDNNPVMYVDPNGENTEAVGLWTSTMWWLCGIDTVLPIGDAIYVGGIILLAIIAFSSNESNTHKIEVYAYDIPALDEDEDADVDDNDDFDGYDDYYDDDDNFGGRTKVGKGKGNMPGDHKKQNKQFEDATRGLTKDQQRILHDRISGKGLGYHEILEERNKLFR